MELGGREGGGGGGGGEIQFIYVHMCSLLNLSCFTGMQWLLTNSCYLCAYSSILRCMKQQQYKFHCYSSYLLGPLLKYWGGGGGGGAVAFPTPPLSPPLLLVVHI